MFDTASGWLITSLDANPMTVSLVQVAVSFPLFLFTLPAGALADVIDSRRLLIVVELAIRAVSVIFAGLVSLDLATPVLLLATTFLLGVGGALTSPAWGATTPLLVPKEDLDSATALNGVGFNVGRPAGPALGGLVIAAAGIAVPFWSFAASNAVIVAALLWWRKPRKAAESLPNPSKYLQALPARWRGCLLRCGNVAADCHILLIALESETGLAALRIVLHNRNDRSPIQDVPIVPIPRE